MTTSQCHPSTPCIPLSRTLSTTSRPSNITACLTFLDKSLFFSAPPLKDIQAGGRNKPELKEEAAEEDASEEEAAEEEEAEEELQNRQHDKRYLTTH